jgi:flagellar FliL protein
MTQTTTVPAGDAEVAAPVPATGGTKRLLLTVIPALLAGAAVGTVVVAPRLVAKPASAGAAAEAPRKEKKKEGEATPLFRVENVIVNPAGSGGSRYLVVSVGFEVEDPKAELALRAAEVQLRDAITGLLERQTLQALTAPGARDSIRVALGAVVKPFLNGATARIYIPQFLLQ